LNIIDRARERLFSHVAGKPKEITDANEQTEEDKAIVTFVRSKLEDVRSSGARIAQEGINLTNIAYLCGFDNIFFDSTSRSFKPVANPNAFIRRNRVHVNRILPTVQNRLARLTKSPPRWDVAPNSPDEEDKDAARLSQQVLEQLWDNLYINRKRIPLTMWLQQCGSSYLKASWDPTLGKKRVMPVEKQNEDGTVEMTYEVVAEGDIRVDVCSFFEVYPDPLAKSWDELKYLIQAKVRAIDYFRDQYPENGKLVKEEDCWLNSLQYEARINSMNTANGSSGTNQSLKNSAIEISYYERPSSKHPYGRHIIIANGVKLKDGILPIDELPFVKFDDIIVGGKFNAEAIITHLRPLQDQLNKGKTMRAAFLNRMLTGKMIAPRSANIAAESFNDQSGEWLKYDQVPGANEPKALDMPTIPQYAYQEEEVLKDDINDTAGINEASRGQMPSSSIPAIGMQLLVEQDDTRIGIETESHEHSYADFGRILLKFVDGYYVTDRLLKIAGENQEYAVRKFKGEDLKGNFDVRVIRGSTLPGSKTLKRQEIMNLYDRGMFGNPQEELVRQNVMAMLEFGDEFTAFERRSLRMAQIQRGITMIEDLGEKPPVSEFDDHPLWIQQLDDYRISEKFLKLEEFKQALVLQTMNEHINFLQEMTQPGAADDPEQNPELTPTDAAEQHANELSAQPPPPDAAEPAPEAMPEGAI
jgi:hypothetical protein